MTRAHKYIVVLGAMTGSALAGWWIGRGSTGDMAPTQPAGSSVAGDAIEATAPTPVAATAGFARETVHQAPDSRAHDVLATLPLVAAPEAPRLDFELVQGLPPGLLGVYRGFLGAAEKLEPRIRNGQASPTEQVIHAQFTAMMSLMRHNRYWYVGPKELCPRVPASSAYAGYLTCSAGGGDIAVFELLQQEFPGSYELEGAHATRSPRRGGR